MKDCPEFSSFILSRVCGILRGRSDTLNIFSQTSAESRIAGVLLSLVEQEGGKTPFTINLRRQDIAEMAGLTLETTIRIVRKLHAKGVIGIERSKIVVEATEMLRKLAG
jgi:CRP-like cAMP-binding protein